jgi:hypothetical protein
MPHPLVEQFGRRGFHYLKAACGFWLDPTGVVNNSLRQYAAALLQAPPIAAILSGSNRSMTMNSMPYYCVENRFFNRKT